MVKDCTQGLLLEQRINMMEKEFSESIERIEKTMTKFHGSMEDKMTNLFNHQSSRVPPSIAWAMATGTAIIGSLATILVSHLLG